MKKVFSMFLALICAITVVAGFPANIYIADPQDAASVVARLQKKQDAEQIYIETFMQGFRAGFTIASDRELKTLDLRYVRKTVENFVATKLVPALKADGLYEDWRKAQFAPEQIFLVEDVAQMYICHEAYSTKELMAAIEKHVSGVKQKHPVIARMENDPKYVGMIVILNRDIIAHFKKEGK